MLSRPAGGDEALIEAREDSDILPYQDIRKGLQACKACCSLGWPGGEPIVSGSPLVRPSFSCQ